jgi:uncharacterized protein YecE (DUF72 family)
MQFFVGTSGYSYKEWKGAFYPAKLRQSEMLSYYAKHYSAVEINSTFRRMPDAGVLVSWAGQVPQTFRFALKSPQTITHYKRLKNVEAETDDLLHSASALKRRLGPILFQLPPNFKKDVSRLVAFLRIIDKKTASAFEFRHESWFDDEVYNCLRANRCALCVADADDLPRAALVRTARWGYVRLRREKYSKARLREWVEKIRSQGWEKAYVFFKHEDTGSGPKLAARFLELVEG